jgi:hypothetical protein
VENKMENPIVENKMESTIVENKITFDPHSGKKNLIPRV